MRIGRNPERLPFSDLEEPPQEAPRGVLVTVRAQHRIDQRALPIDGAIEVTPAPGDLHIGLIDVPGDARAAAPLLADRLRAKRRGRASASWYTDETYVKVAGRWSYLYRAIDREGG